MGEKTPIFQNLAGRNRQGHGKLEVTQNNYYCGKYYGTQVPTT